jgi:lactate dehydrogenase-like 2-hydroxyacid dehydrogenase
LTIPLLVLIDIADPDLVSKLTAAGFAPTFATTAAAREKSIEQHGDRFRAVLTHGSAGLSAAEMGRLPHLEIVSALGVGHENIDDSAARARGIHVTHGPGTNASTVADHALALLLAIVRGIVRGDATVRRGEWEAARASRIINPIVTGKRLGIVGLGTIGLEIARRGAGGFGMTVGYHNRSPRSGTEHTYFPTILALADWSDFLVVAAPGGAATRGLVNADVLTALGPHGYLVNIGRGSVVDTGDLVTALNEGHIAGAALDVVDGEPDVPAGLLAAPNVILTPHTAGRSPESIEAMVGLVIANLTAHFAGKPVLTPVRS